MARSYICRANSWLLHLTPLFRAERHPEGFDDRLGDLVLDREHVLHGAVVTIRPQPVAVLDADQLGGDSQLLSRFANAALEHRRHAQLTSDLPDVQTGPSHLEGGSSGGDAQILNPRQPIDELLSDALAEVVLVLLRAHVDERQHGHRWPDLFRPFVRLGLELFQIGTDVGRALIALEGVLLQRSGDHPGELRRYLYSQLGDRVGRVSQDRRDGVGRGLTLERARPRRHLVENDPKREEIRSVIRGPALDLLRRHVGHRAHHLTVLGQRLGGRLVAALGVELRAQLGEPEIEDLDVAVGRHHDVGRLEIAMDDAARMRGDQRVDHRLSNSHQLFDPHPRRRNHPLEGAPLDIAHGQKPRPVRLFHRVDGDDVGVLDRGDRLGFALEPLQVLRTRREIVGKHLDRHLAIEIGVLGQVDGPHAPLSELGEDPVVGKGLADHDAGPAASVSRPSSRAMNRGCSRRGSRSVSDFIQVRLSPWPEARSR
jgi:hypothetical protein